MLCDLQPSYHVAPNEGREVASTHALGFNVALSHGHPQVEEKFEHPSVGKRVDCGLVVANLQRKR